VKKLCGEDVTKTSPTLGFEIKTLAHNGYKLNIWDVGGQTTLRSYWRNYYEQTEGLIWVIDSTDIRRLKDCKEELHKLLGEERLAGATLLIFANKQVGMPSVTHQRRKQASLGPVGRTLSSLSLCCTSLRSQVRSQPAASFFAALLPLGPTDRNQPTPFLLRCALLLRLLPFRIFLERRVVRTS